MIDDASSLEAARARKEARLARFVLWVPALAVVAAAIAWALGVRPGRADWIVFGALLFLTMLGVEVGYHRYFTHRSFTARAPLEWCLAILGSSAFLGPVIWWAATHRRHYLHTDGDDDPHSPHRGRGLWDAHAGWLLDPERTRMTVSASQVKDLYANRRILACNRHYLLCASSLLALAALLGLLFGGARGLLVGLLWGGLTRIFVVSHLVWAVNSLGHRFGARARQATSGEARNLLWLVFPTLGGGWHANHHDRPSRFSTSAAWWQLDPGAWIIRTLFVLRLAEDRRS